MGGAKQVFSQKMKQKLLKSKGFVSCEICGWGFKDNFKSVNLHHLIPTAAGGENIEENIVFLCPNHHALAHFLTYSHGGEYHGPKTKEGLMEMIKDYEYEKDPRHEELIQTVYFLFYIKKIRPTGLM